MAAMWGIAGTTDHDGVEEIGRRLQHRGLHELDWTPAPHVRFVWRQEDAARASVATPVAPLMFTGVITNRDELAHLLGRCADHGAPRRDAELLWDFYRLNGRDAFAVVNGQFAVALYDAVADEVVLASDRWAAQPLYVARIANCWAFATEYRALLALPQLEASVDRQSLSHLNGTKYLPMRRGMLADVHPVAPGEIVRISGDSCKPEAYAPLRLQIPTDPSERALASGLRTALLAATRSVIQGCDRVGIALSAGLDSTLTLGLVRAIAPHTTIHTYTASFNPDDPDLRLAAEAVRYFGTIHREIILEPEDLPRLLRELVWAMEDPCAREEMLVYHVLAQEAVRDVPLVLYGHMADVLFGGMPRHRLIKLAGSLPFVREPLVDFYDYTQTGMVPRSMLGRILVALYFRGRGRSSLRMTGDASPLCDARLHLAATEPLNTALLAAIRHPTEVAAIERLHARAGVRFGSVFHDTRVAEWAFRLPDRMKIRGRCRKYILRRAARGILPASFIARPKGMIRIVRNQRLRRVIEAMAADLLAPQVIAKRRLFNPSDVSRLLRHWRSEEEFYRIWTLLLIELWCRTFIDGRGAVPARLTMTSPEITPHPELMALRVQTCAKREPL
jgi:asparagine synthase (glutamine-hydrolysing)